MALGTQPTYTAEQYLAMERRAEYKSELVNGLIFAMAGPTFEHNLIGTNIVVSLATFLRERECYVTGTDLKVRVEETGLFTYPDAMVICGRPEFHDDRHDVVTNPLVIVEVLSPSTEAYDRGAKFHHYQRRESLHEYVLVSQAEPRVERYLLRDGEWIYYEVAGLDASLRLDSLDIDIPLSEIYAKLRFPAAAYEGAGAEAQPLKGPRIG